MKILSYCAVNPARRYPQAEASILQVEGVAQTVFDFADDATLPWYENILRKYQMARGMMLAGGFDGLLFLESDMLIPRDAARRLSDVISTHDAGVAYGLYCWRHGVAWWNAYIALDEEAGFSLSDPLAREHAPASWPQAVRGEPFPCYGVGFGCTLVRRDVLEQINFRNFAGEQSFYVDWCFAADCNARGIRQMCDPAVVCGHITDVRMILYPDLRELNLYRSEYLMSS